MSSSVTVRLRSHTVMKWIENLLISFFVSIYLLTQAECGKSSIALMALSVLFLSDNRRNDCMTLYFDCDLGLVDVASAKSNEKYADCGRFHVQWLNRHAFHSIIILILDIILVYT